MNRATQAEIDRQVAATHARPVHTLPAAWYEPGCDARMADWIERFVPVAARLHFTYGRTDRPHERDGTPNPSTD